MAKIFRRLLSVAVMLSALVHAEEAAPPASSPSTPAEQKPASAPAPAAPEATTPKVPEAPAPKAAETKFSVDVTASRLSANPEKEGASITTVTAQEVEVSQDTLAAEILRTVPGVTIGQTGRKGSITNLFIRGGNNNQTEVMMDGWRVNRQGQGYDFDGMDPVGLDRMEVSRGQASALYGTEALTGTVNIVSQRGQGRPSLTASAAAGTYDTDRETLDIQGSEGKFAYHASGAHLLREGASEINSRLQTYNYAGRFDFDITPDHTIKLILRGKDLTRGFYESVSLATQVGTSIVPADPNDTLRSKDFLAGFEYEGRVLPIWKTDLRLGYYRTEHAFDLPQPAPALNFLLNNPMLGGPRSADSSAIETRPSVEWRNTVTTFESENFNNYVTAGVYAETESFDQDDTVLFANVEKHHRNISGYAQDRLEIFKRVNLEAGVRHEDNGEFGGLTTGRGNVSIAIPESHTRIFGSVGNGYRPPSFFELFAPFIGNPALTVERNFAFDAGIEQNFWKDRITLRGTYFNNHFSDFISLSSAPPFRSTQQHNAEARGYELEAIFKPLKQLTLIGNATLLHTEDSFGNRLIRRPPQTYTARLIARPLVDLVPKKYDGLDIYFDVIHESSRTDLGPGPTFPLNPTDVTKTGNPHYTRADVAVSYRFLNHWRAFVKVENANDEKYQDILTFPADRSNTMAGLEFNWKF